MRVFPILIFSCCLVLYACTDPVDGDPGAGGSSSITLTWKAPIENVDSSCTEDLSGFEIYYGNASGQYTDSTVVPLDQASCVDSTDVTACGTVQVCTYTLTGMPADTWYLVVSANDIGGNQSMYSNELIRVVSN